MSISLFGSVVDNPILNENLLELIEFLKKPYFENFSNDLYANIRTLLNNIGNCVSIPPKQYFMSVKKDINSIINFLSNEFSCKKKNDELINQISLIVLGQYRNIIVSVNKELKNSSKTSLTLLQAFLLITNFQIYFDISTFTSKTSLENLDNIIILYEEITPFIINEFFSQLFEEVWKLLSNLFESNSKSGCSLNLTLLENISNLLGLYSPLNFTPFLDNSLNLLKEWENFYQIFLDIYCFLSIKCFFGGTLQNEHFNKEIEYFSKLCENLKNNQKMNYVLLNIHKLFILDFPSAQKLLDINHEFFEIMNKRILFYYFACKIGLFVREIGSLNDILSLYLKEKYLNYNSVKKSLKGNDEWFKEANSWIDGLIQKGNVDKNIINVLQKLTQ